MEFVASVIGVAAVGVKLSRTLYTLGGRAVAANHNINRIATNVTLFSSSLKHVGQVLADSQSLHTPEAAETVQQIMDQCERLFEDIARMASGSKNPRDGHSIIAANDGRQRMSILKRIRWSFEQPKVESLLAQLEYLKTTLCIVIQTLNLAAITVKIRQESLPSEQQLEEVKQERLHVETLVWAQRLSITVMNNVCVHSEPNSRGRSPSPADSEETIEARTPKLLTLGEDENAASLMTLGGHLDFLDTALTSNTQETEHTINLPSDLVDELLQRWTRIPVSQPAHLLEAQTSYVDDLEQQVMKVQGSPPSSRGRGSSLNTLHEGEAPPPDLKLEKVETPEDMRKDLPSSEIKPSDQLLGPTFVPRPRGQSPSPAAAAAELPATISPPPPPRKPSPDLSRTISNPEQDLPLKLQITPHTHPVNGHTSQFPPFPGATAPPPHLRSQTSPAGSPMSPSTMQYYTSPTSTQNGPNNLNGINNGPGPNYRRPYVESVAPSTVDSDEEDFVPVKQPIRRDSDRSHPPSPPRRDGRGGISEAGLDIPWRIRISPTRYFDFQDSKIVGPRTPYKPSEPLEWIYSQPGARTEINKEWVTEQALAEKRLQFFELSPKELRGGSGQGWIACEAGGWRILRALTFAEVEGLVERTIALFKERSGRGQGSAQKGISQLPQSRPYARSQNQPPQSAPRSIPNAAGHHRTASFSDNGMTRPPSSYNPPGASGGELPWMPPPRRYSIDRERPSDRNRDRQYCNNAVYHDEKRRHDLMNDGETSWEGLSLVPSVPNSNQLYSYVMCQNVCPCTPLSLCKSSIFMTAFVVCTSAVCRLSLLGRIGQPLDHVLALGDGDERHTRDLPDAPLELAIVGGNNVDAVLDDAVDDAVIRVNALVVALEALPALVARNLQREAVLGAELLELGHDAGGDDGAAGGVEGVHEGLEQGQLGADGVREEVGVDEDGVGRGERRVVREEHGRRGLRDLADHVGRLVARLLQCRGRRLLVGLEAGVALADDALDGRELARLLGLAHVCGGGVGAEAGRCRWGVGGGGPVCGVRVEDGAKSASNFGILPPQG
ncbi:hypothetical protein FH972_021334 [Carpinus fangiana]|uniref:Fungal N-terminal domain-containing protein n=1 Tax=Carpinus fangiana TaxID=176857 RepID=A0A5N6KPN4_9ROSI|nr:hypothetical protein FH972_021334 [Carpinus fangiana]